jgi:drug/metabolite transporter (DMT)-like permease
MKLDTPSRHTRRFSNAQLFALCVLIWGTTWYAIVHQIGHASPEVGVTLRFALAGVVVLLWARWRGEKLGGDVTVHALVALQGVCMYSLSYLCTYHAEKHVPSGLVAVGYSLSPLISGTAAWALWRHPLGLRFVLGGLLGVVGVALIFWPELGAASQRESAGLGLVLTLSAVAFSAAGSLAASRNEKFRLLFWPAMGWSLMYGALCSAVLLLLQGQGAGLLHLPTAWDWWVSLVYLALAGTVLTFSAYLTLQQRLGPGKAATVGVMVPVLALLISTALEGYRPQLWTLAGVLLALFGNRLMLRSGPKARAGASPPDGRKSHADSLDPLPSKASS